MRVDFPDIVANEFGRFLCLILFLLGACLVGAMIGGLAWGFGHWDLTPEGLLRVVPELLRSPALLIGDWSFPNVGVLAFALTILFVTDRTGYKAWGIMVGLESIFALLGTRYQHEPASVLVAASLCWLVLLAMVETGIWVVRSVRVNRWVRELAELSAENAMRNTARRQTQEEGAAGVTRDNRQPPDGPCIDGAIR